MTSLRVLKCAVGGFGIGCFATFVVAGHLPSLFAGGVAAGLFLGLFAEGSV